MARGRAPIDQLRTVGLFAKLSDKQLRQIASTGTQMTFPAGTVLVDQGQTGREALLVLDGDIRVKRNGRTIGMSGPGSFVGELALLDHGPRTATVIAETPVTAMVFHQREFLALLNDQPPLAIALLGSLAARIREIDKKHYD